MYDIDAIEAINFEQLATVTDRLLLRGRVTRRRLSTNKIIVRNDHAAFRPELADDRTLLVRRTNRFPAGLAVVTSLTAIAASLACML